MPPKHGNASVNISLPADLAEQLTLLASKPGASKSQVVEQALSQLIAGSASQTLLDSLHQRLDALTAALKDVEQSTKALGLQVQAVGERVTSQERQYQEFTQAVCRLYDGEKAARNGQAGSRWGQIFGRT